MSSAQHNFGGLRGGDGRKPTWENRAFQLCFTLKWSGSWSAQLVALLLGVPAAAERFAPDLVHVVPVALARAVRDEFHAADLQLHDAEALVRNSPRICAKREQGIPNNEIQYLPDKNVRGLLDITEPAQLLLLLQLALSAQPDLCRRSRRAHYAAAVLRRRFLDLGQRPEREAEGRSGIDHPQASARKGHEVAGSLSVLPQQAFGLLAANLYVHISPC